MLYFSRDGWKFDCLVLTVLQPLDIAGLHARWMSKQILQDIAITAKTAPFITLVHGDHLHDAIFAGPGCAGLLPMLQSWSALHEHTSFDSDLLESSIPTGTIEVDGSVAFDLFAHWQVSRQLLLSASLRNALDENWQDAVGFPARGRTLRITADFAI